MVSNRPSPSIRAGLEQRAAGILLHPTSLPGPGANGTLGATAEAFIEFLHAAGVGVWQILPLGPPHADLSPYRCQSTHAINPRLLDVTRLIEWGWLKADSPAAGATGDAVVARVGATFSRLATTADREDYAEFSQSNAPWLEDFALYRVLRAAHDNAPWWLWPAELKNREPAALAAARSRLGEALERCRFEQFLLHRQWRAIRCYANERSVRLFGDLPIFVAEDSADVWGTREYFRLDANGRAAVVTGVPPDAFSETGQRWGNPHYDWERMQADDFAWWKRRLHSELDKSDLVRIDHFRGFAAAWEIAADSEVATEGEWVPAPGDALFESLAREFGGLPLVAEDLGLITEDVRALRERFGIPGMKVLQFAFDGGADNPYLPHNHRVNAVVYSATHDNDTTAGWFAKLPEAGRKRICDYLAVSPSQMPWAFVRTALASVGILAVLPMQDVLGLGSEHRMNTPGMAEGNWRWRLSADWTPPDLVHRLAALVELYGRRAPHPQREDRR